MKEQFNNNTIVNLTENLKNHRDIKTEKENEIKTQTKRKNIDNLAKIHVLNK